MGQQPSTPGPPGGGRAVAWAGFVFGSVMSTAANVLSTWIPPEGARPGWAPSVAAQIGAAVWPLALLLSVEVLSRVQWPREWQWGLARYGGAGTVAIGSAVISYGHLHDVLDAWRYGAAGSLMGPLVLDGLMVVSGFALLAPAGQTSTAARTVADLAAETPTATQEMEPVAVSAPAIPQVEPPARKAPTSTGRGRTAPPPATAPTGPTRKTATAQQADEARKAMHAAGDHTACKARTCRVVRDRAGNGRVVRVA